MVDLRHLGFDAPNFPSRKPTPGRSSGPTPSPAMPTRQPNRITAGENILTTSGFSTDRRGREIFTRGRRGLRTIPRVAAESDMLAPATSDADVVTAGQAAWRRLRGHTSWADWKAVSTALALGRDCALRVAGANRPYGRRYVTAFADWLKQHQFDAINKSVRGVAIKIADRLPDIEAWRAQLPETLRLRLCHPDSVWRGFQKARRGFGTDAECKHPPSRHFVLWPPHHKERARRKLVRALEIYGPDPVRLVEATLTGAIPHPEDLEELLAFQQPRPRGRVPITLRPPSPSAVLAQARKELHP
jgi:hypothetical protein